jgi:hypothetical protein
MLRTTVKAFTIMKKAGGDLLAKISHFLKMIHIYVNVTHGLHDQIFKCHCFPQTQCPFTIFCMTPVWFQFHSF